MKGKKTTFSIELKVTDRCNQKCSHCVNEDGYPTGRDVDWASFNRRIEEWAANRDRSEWDLREIRLTGGEPLVDFDAVLAIVSCCRRLGIRSGINTNGLLLTPERIRCLKENGVEIIKISFDAVTPEVYGLVRDSIASIEPLVNTVRVLVDDGFKVILRFTLTRFNLGELAACHELAGRLRVNKFQIKPLIRSGRAEGIDAYLSREEVNAALHELSKTNAAADLATEVLCWPASPDTGFHYKICGNADKIYIAPDGDVSICNYIRPGDQPVLGNIFQTPLEEILARRHNDSLYDCINGNRLIKGCPNKEDFEGLTFPQHT